MNAGRGAPFVLLLFMFLISCSSTPLRLDTASQHIDYDDIDFSKGRHLSASVCGYQVWLFIPADINDRQVRAYRMLLGQADGDYICNVQIKESWTYFYAGTAYRTTMEAMAYPRKR